MTTQEKTNQEKFDEVIFNENGVRILFDGRVRIDDEVAIWENIKDDNRFEHVGTYNEGDDELYKVKGDNDWYLEVAMNADWETGEEVNGTDADIETILEQYN